MWTPAHGRVWSRRELLQSGALAAQGLTPIVAGVLVTLIVAECDLNLIVADRALLPILGAYHLMRTVRDCTLLRGAADSKAIPDRF